MIEEIEPNTWYLTTRAEYVYIGRKTRISKAGNVLYECEMQIIGKTPTTIGIRRDSLSSTDIVRKFDAAPIVNQYIEILKESIKP